MGIATEFSTDFAGPSDRDNNRAGMVAFLSASRYDESRTFWRTGGCAVEYQIRRSRRKSLAIEVTREGMVLVRAPERLPLREIQRVVERHSDWIAQKQTEQAALRRAFPEPDAAEERRLRQRAAECLPPLVEQWSARMGVQPAGVKITSARTRHGSCSAQNRLCFSWRLMRYPEEAVEAVVVHELAHIRHKNHSAAFYEEVERYLPDYQNRICLLKCPMEEGTKDENEPK